MAMLFTVFEAGAMTIPLTKGNTWCYTYFEKSVSAAPRNISSVTQTGLLRFSVDSVKIFSDTTFFSLSYSDSGTEHQYSKVFSESRQAVDTLVTIQKYSMEYHIRYVLSGDTIVELDQRFSPGYSKSLLSFLRQRDTSYSRIPWYPGSDTFSIKTDEYPVTIGNAKMTLLCEKRSKTLSHTGPSGGYHNSYLDTNSWIPGIGKPYTIHISLSSSYPSNISSSYSILYSMVTFNNIPIPPISQLSTKLTTPFLVTRYSKSPILKTVMLAAGSRNGYLPQGGCFNLRGQKTGALIRSQLVIQRLRR